MSIYKQFYVLHTHHYSNTGISNGKQGICLMMSQNDGLDKLIDFLNTTRRQAELSISALNNRVNELQSACDAKDKEINEVTSERDYYKNNVEQLKLENSKKWRLQERDDWKSLVDSVQNDRSRLQDHCLQLEISLENAQSHIIALETELSHLLQDENQNYISHEDSEQSKFEEPLDQNHVYLSPPHSPNNKTNRPDETNSFVDSPIACSRKMKLELEKAYERIEVERRAAETEKLSLEAEIIRLRGELASYKQHSDRHRGGANGHQQGITTTTRDPQDKDQDRIRPLESPPMEGESQGARDDDSHSTHQSKSIWTNPVESVISYFFSPFSSYSNNNNNHYIKKNKDKILPAITL